MPPCDLSLHRVRHDLEVHPIRREISNQVAEASGAYPQLPSSWGGQQVSKRGASEAPMAYAV